MKTSNYDFNKYRLMAPGPVQMSEGVLKALSEPMIHHRTPAFVKILNTALSGLKYVFETTNPVMILPTTGTGAMEAALVNTLSPGDHILCVAGGKFGERFEKIASAYNISTSTVDVKWGETVDAKVIDSFLASHPNTKAVTVQACETSTGVMHPIEEIAKVVKNYPNTLLIVDGITAVGATKLPMDQWSIDILLSGSQKAFQIPTGLAFISLSKKAWAFAENSTCPKFYLNLKKEMLANQQGQTHFSSSVSLIRALNVVLQEIEKQTLPAWQQRVTNLSIATQKAALALGLKLFSSSPSPTLTAIEVPQNVDGAALRKHLEEKYNITVMGGQDHLKGKIIRIGHMGDISDDDALSTIHFLALSLNELGYAIDEKVIEKATQEMKALL